MEGRGEGVIMVENSIDVRTVTVREILSEDLTIPHFQRRYSWTIETALTLFDDIQEAMSPKGAGQVRYVLGTVILLKNINNNELQIVDGLQRLTTLLLLQKILSEDPNVLNLVSGSQEIKTSLQLVRLVLLRKCNSLEPVSKSNLLKFLNDQCEMIRIETKDPDEAFRVFDSQNYRGKSLLPHDLLKAYHLREMETELAIKQRIVEEWEARSERDLERLFSIYLWRIRCWSRGKPATEFSTQDIESYKGISKRTKLGPYSEYHSIAQISVPSMLSKDFDNINQHTMFQIDAPIMSGKHFFEMISFFLIEIETLRKECFESHWEMFASSDTALKEKSSKSRYRYVSELYLAVMLYYKNKFGNDNFKDVKMILFRWAYSLRVKLERVQFDSVNNLAIGKSGKSESPFLILRNALKSNEINKVISSIEKRNDDFEKDLFELLNELGSSTI
ncbi:DUF262 domain-containing protein [Leptospira levettii]|uniref:DUF262 domain-containing protein n=1 Tax=Leptospira levettii TaxID=2023178 RepID=UPI001EE9F48A|nr:DUF262 domain-containing protein [Leptospira levettii]MCG6150275.1 DUF262 domain-containing protein [Leptospira levettii]